MSAALPQYHQNPAQRTPCILVLDASASMSEVVYGSGRRRIDELNEGLVHLQRDLMRDETASMRVQLAIVCVGGPVAGAELIMDWTDAVDFQPPKLRAGGMTALAEGMLEALRCVEQQKEKLKRHGVGYTRPWIIVISDGEPTSSRHTWQEATQACHAAESGNKCTIYPIGVGHAKMDALQQLSSTKAILMKEARFREYFQWLSSSLRSSSRSSPGQRVQLEAVDPWAVVST